MLYSEKKIILNLRCSDNLDREDFVFIEKMVRKFHESDPLTPDCRERLDLLIEKYHPESTHGLEQYDLDKMRKQRLMP